MVKIAKSGLFLGEYSYRLDEKHRMALPKRIRVEVSSLEVVLSRGFEPCIAGFDKETWQEMAKQQLAMPYFEENGRKLRRQLFSNAVIVELDSQGRIVLPDQLLEWAQLNGITDEVTIVGVGDHFEIWNQSKWEEYNRM